jgi:hypothetical protein
MIPNEALAAAKVVCRSVAERLYPEQKSVLEPAWMVLLPVFEQWLTCPLSARRLQMDEMYTTLGLGLQEPEAADPGLPMMISVVVATILEIWDTQRPKEPQIRATVRNCTQRFGVPTKLAQVLVEHVTPFCLRLHENMPSLDEAERQNQTALVEQAVQGRAAPQYDILVSGKLVGGPATLADVREFKQNHSPPQFALWIDESHGEAIIDGAKMNLGPRLIRVLRCLAEFRGQCVDHETLVARCAEGANFAYTDSREGREKTAHRWIAALRAGLPSSARCYIVAKPHGFLYDGPNSTCIIRRRCA